MSLFQSKEISSILKNYISSLPKRGRGEVSRIAKHLGVSSTLVSQVLSGKKAFTFEQVEKLTVFLGFVGQERDYMIGLSHLERAGTKELKSYWQEKLLTIREQSKKLSNQVVSDRQLDDRDIAKFYSHPIFALVQLFTSIDSKIGKSIDEVAERFGLSRIQSVEILNFLKNSGLCVVEDGRFKVGVQKIHLPDDSPFLPFHHTNCRVKAIEKTVVLEKEELMYSSFVSLSKKDFENLREQIAKFIKNFLDQVHASRAEEIACFNVDFFWADKK